MHPRNERLPGCRPDRLLVDVPRVDPPEDDRAALDWALAFYHLLAGHLHRGLVVLVAHVFQLFARISDLAVVLLAIRSVVTP